MATTTDHAASLDEDGASGHSGGPDSLRCPVARCAEVVTGKWTLLLVRDLLAGPRSFSELEDSLAGCSPRTLCERLKLLTREGLLTRTRIRGLPPRTIYELTEAGYALGPIVEAMRAAGEQLLVATPPAASTAPFTAGDCAS